MDNIIDFCQNIPKIELHAHLNGSLTVSTVEKLISMKKNSNETFDLSPYTQLSTSNVKSLTDCFKVFQIIHCLTDTPEAVYQATCDVIEDFRRDNVKYLELRSTPRAVENKMSKEQYVAAIILAIQDSARRKADNIIVKLLLAIDRRNSISTAMETVRLAEQYMHNNDEIVIGVDLSGDPQVGNAEIFLPALQKARQSNLKLALHVAEVPEKESEVEALLALPPDRIGHGTFLHRCNNGKVKAEQLKLPIEMCLTSNVICGTVTSYKEHHFGIWKKKNHPCVLCTDDKGVFGTSLSHEYWIAATNFCLSKEDLWNMSYNSINYSFADYSVKEELRRMWKSKHKELLKVVTGLSSE